MRDKIRPRVVLGFVMAMVLGALLAVASHSLEWSSTSKFIAGVALAAGLGLFLTPLVMLPIGTRRKADHAHAPGSSAETRR